MKKIVTIALAALLALSCMACNPLKPGPQGGPGNQITEDSPGWNCSTMGNKVCGAK
jgi:hypothetical protein